MFDTDNRFVINLGDAPTTPVEQAVIAYQQFRDVHPLPEGWTQQTMMFNCLDTTKGLTHGATPEINHGYTFSCYLECREYYAELTFGPYVYHEVGSSIPTTVGGCHVEFFRTDKALATGIEMAAIVRLLFPTEFSVVRLEHSVLDGDLSERPLPTVRAEEQPNLCPGTHLGFSLDMALVPATETPGTGSNVQPTPARIEILCQPWPNPRTKAMEQIRSEITEKLKMFRGIRRWLKQQRGLLVEDQWRPKGKWCRNFEQKYGRRKIKSLVGMYKRSAKAKHLTTASRLKTALLRVDAMIAAAQVIAQAVGTCKTP